MAPAPMQTELPGAEQEPGRPEREASPCKKQKAEEAGVL